MAFRAWNVCRLSRKKSEKVANDREKSGKVPIFFFNLPTNEQVTLQDRVAVPLPGFLRLMNRYPAAKTIVVVAIAAASVTTGKGAMLNETVFSAELPNSSVAYSVIL